MLFVFSQEEHIENIKGESIVSKVYDGAIQHTPGMAFREGGMGREINEIQSPLFAGRYGSDIVAHSNVGLTTISGVDYQVPKPLVVGNDIGQKLPDIRNAQTGKLEPNPGSALAFESKGHKDEPMWVTTIRDYFLPAFERQDLLKLWLMDRHFNPEFLNRSAMTRYKIDQKQLSRREQATVNANAVLKRKAATGEFITVGEYEQIFGGIVDKEDINFLPHCRDGLVRWIPSIENAISRSAKKALSDQQTLGLTRPIVRDIEDYKTGLNPVSPPDANGMNDNVIAHVFRNAWQGIYTDGPHRWWKTMLHFGTAGEYTNDFVTNFGVDQGAIVIRLMAGSGMLGIASTYDTVYTLTNRYPKNFFPTWDWIPELMGPEPAGYKAHSRRMQDAAFEEAFGPNGSGMRRAVTDLARSGDNGFESTRLINMFNQKRFDGHPLFWSGRELIDHLKKGG